MHLLVSLSGYGVLNARSQHSLAVKMCIFVQPNNDKEVLGSTQLQGVVDSSIFTFLRES